MKTANEILDNVIEKVRLLRKWTDELTTFQKYIIQEADDTLQDVLDEIANP